MQQYSFSLSQKLDQETLSPKQWFLYPAYRIHNGLQNEPPEGLSISAMDWAYQPKPPLHGLSLRKSLIKNHATLFQVGSSSRSNTTRLHKAQHIECNKTKAM